jgi:hypothetical protein
MNGDERNIMERMIKKKIEIEFHGEEEKEFISNMLTKKNKLKKLVNFNFIIKKYFI